MNPRLHLTVELAGPATAGRRLPVVVTATAEQPCTVTELRVWWKAGWHCPPPLWLPAFALTSGGSRTWDSPTIHRTVAVAAGAPGRWELDLAAPTFPTVPSRGALGLQAEHTLEVQAVTDDLHLANARLDVVVGAPPAPIADTEAQTGDVRLRCDLPRATAGGVVEARITAGSADAVHLVREEVRRRHRPASRPGRRHHRADSATPDPHGRVALTVPADATPTAVLPDGEVRWYLEAGPTRLEVAVHT